MKNLGDFIVLIEHKAFIHFNFCTAKNLLYAKRIFLIVEKKCKQFNWKKFDQNSKISVDHICTYTEVL